MQKQVISEITYIEKTETLDNIAIEKILIDKFGELIRWAIVEVQEDKLKVCFTYEKGG